MSKLRLIKVIVQPIFVLDDGENVSEIDHPAVAIPAADWPSYSSERFPAEVKAWQERLDVETVAPNRAARRSKPTVRKR